MNPKRYGEPPAPLQRPDNSLGSLNNFFWFFLFSIFSNVALSFLQTVVERENQSIYTLVNCRIKQRKHYINDYNKAPT